MGRFVGRLVRSVLSIAALVVVWWGSVALFHVPAFLLPSPAEVLPKLVFLFNNASLMTDVWVTSSEILQGFVLGAIIGIVTGVVFVRLPRIERLMSPLVLIIQTAPKIAIAPLLLLWLGLGSTPKIVLVAIIVFFPTMMGSIAGLRFCDRAFHDLAHVLRLTPWQRLWRIEIPFAAPSIMAGLRIATSQAVTAAVIGELLGANRGLGYLLSEGQENNDAGIVIGVVLVLSFIGWFFYVLVSLVERRVLYWHTSRLTQFGST